MKKALLLIPAILFFTACNQSEERSNGGVVVQESFAQTIMQTFNTAPNPKEYFVTVEPKDNDILRRQSAAILRLLADMKGQPQRFTIKPLELNELQGEYGTKVTLDPNSFTYKDGKEIDAPIDIELKECYTTGEMLEENLITTVGNKIFESKAAVYVSATCNGQAIELKEGEEIDIQFPFAVNENDGYGFYYGTPVKNTISWLAAGGSDEAGVAKTAMYKPEFVYKGYGVKEYLSAQLEYPEEARRNELSSKVEVTFTVDKNGKVRDVSCVSGYKTFRDEIITTLEHMPKWKPAAYGKRKVNAQVKLSVDFNLRSNEQVIVDFSDNSIVPLVNDRTDATFTSKVYSRKFDQMGWIACNRITTISATKADVVIQDDADSDVRIVIKNKNAIVRGNNCVGYTRFDDLGIGQQVYVVAVRHTKGEVYYALQPLTLEKQTVVSLNWIKGSEEDFEMAVRHLNPVV